MNTKQIVQIAIVVVGLAVAGVSVALFNPLKPAVDLSNTVVLVDTETGDLFRVSIKRRGILPPLRSPVTGNLSLVPISERDGRWIVSEKWFEEVEQVGIDSDVWRKIQEGDFQPESTTAPLIEPAY